MSLKSSEIRWAVGNVAKQLNEDPVIFHLFLVSHGTDFILRLSQLMKPLAKSPCIWARQPSPDQSLWLGWLGQWSPLDGLSLPKPTQRIVTGSIPLSCMAGKNGTLLGRGEK